MTLYQELPKQSIMSELRHHFTEVELDVLPLDIVGLLNPCRTLEELHERINDILRKHDVSAAIDRLHYQNMPSFFAGMIFLCLPV